MEQACVLVSTKQLKRLCVGLHGCSWRTSSRSGELGLSGHDAGGE